MNERHEEYMKRRSREEDDAREAKLVAEYEERQWKRMDQLMNTKNRKIYESPDGGNTVFERDFGDKKRTKIQIMLDENEKNIIPDYKYNEDNLIKEFKDYIDSTYSQHYSLNKFQATEFIIDSGHGTGFCIGNVLKYAQRYGKKGNRDDARKDLMKVLHYTLLQLYVHDNLK